MAKKTCALLEQLQTLPDPRRQGKNLKHRLDELLLIGLCAVVAGANDCVEVATWAGRHLDFLRTFLDLPNGVPSHDTFSRVLALVPPATLQGLVLPWLQQRRGLPGDLVHLDGKALRNTRHRSAQLGALHVVSAWASATGLTLGQVAVDAKSNEITAIPELLELLDLKGCVVTIDAAGCQKEIAAQIVAQEAAYVLALKDNQPTLRAQAADYFLEQFGREKPDGKLRHLRQVEEGHGRTETRETFVAPAPPMMTAAGAWL